MLAIVDGELSESQPISPAFLFLGTEEPQILLNLLVHDLHLTICLRVMHSGELGGDAESFAEVSHDLQGELRTTIGDDGVGQAVILPNME